MSKIIKCVIAGDGAVGKSTLLSQILGNFGEKEIVMTPGLNIDVYHITDEITLQIWDLGGQSQFRFMQDDFVRKSEIIFYMYSVEWFHSFLNLDKWINFIASNTDPKLQYLIGNKIDTNNRAITTSEGRKMADSLDFRFFEVSALNNTGISEVITDVRNEIDRILNNTINCSNL